MKHAAALMMLVLPAAAWAQGAEDAKRIDKLVTDLGAEDFAVRETADAELRKIGEAAVPALKKAVEGADAERADRARKILDAIAKAKLAPPPHGAFPPTIRLSSSFVYRDLSSGVTFKQESDGKVEVTVPEEDPKTGKKTYRTFTAESFAAFKAAHPDVVTRFNLESLVPKILPLDEVEQWWGGKKKTPGTPTPPGRMEPPDPFDDESLERWLQEQMKALDELRRRMKAMEGDKEEAPPPPAAPTAPREQELRKSVEFGIKIDPVSDTLRAQLGLDEGAGVQVEFVKEGSIAAKAGVQLHDIIVSLKGKPVLDKWEFRRALKDALATPQFEIEVIRTGKRQPLVVKPQQKD